MPQLKPGVHHRHRLYWRIWLAVLATTALFLVLAVIAWKTFGERGFHTQQRALAELAAAVMPPPHAPIQDAQTALNTWRNKLASDLALFAPDTTPVASTAADMPSPSLRDPQDAWLRSPRGGALSLQLPDGRFLVVRRLHGPPPAPRSFATILLLIAAAVGLGIYPVVRRLTRRLENLQRGVERLGRGDLSARVPVHGRDEVAQLAASFNDAAQRIEQLVQSHRSLLANASHELRSPLARVRMAVEMLKTDAKPELKQELERDIAELDALIGEILLASRLDANNGEQRLDRESIDFTGLCAEECARANIALDGVPLNVMGDARLLRRLVRNLLDNARRYGGDAEISVTVARVADNAELRVCDRGPGVPAEERERIFEPFYRARGASESAGGVGLGLALVRTIAQQHGGSVSCEARDEHEGGGSCFCVQLPMAARAIEDRI